jgi:hypothetical protein
LRRWSHSSATVFHLGRKERVMGIAPGTHIVRRAAAAAAALVLPLAAVTLTAAPASAAGPYI